MLVNSLLYAPFFPLSTSWCATCLLTYLKTHYMEPCYRSGTPAVCPSRSLKENLECICLVFQHSESAGAEKCCADKPWHNVTLTSPFKYESSKTLDFRLYVRRGYRKWTILRDANAGQYKMPWSRPSCRPSTSLAPVSISSYLYQTWLDYVTYYSKGERMEKLSRFLWPWWLVLAAGATTARPRSVRFLKRSWAWRTRERGESVRPLTVLADSLPTSRHLFHPWQLHGLLWGPSHSHFPQLFLIYFLKKFLKIWKNGENEYSCI